jgi:hypothetical protein
VVVDHCVGSGWRDAMCHIASPDSGSCQLCCTDAGQPACRAPADRLDGLLHMQHCKLVAKGSLITEAVLHLPVHMTEAALHLPVHMTEAVLHLPVHMTEAVLHLPVHMTEAVLHLPVMTEAVLHLPVHTAILKARHSVSDQSGASQTTSAWPATTAHPGTCHQSCTANPTPPHPAAPRCTQALPAASSAFTASFFATSAAALPSLFCTATSAPAASSTLTTAA